MTKAEFEALVVKVNDQSAMAIKNEAEKLEAKLATVFEKAEKGNLSDAEKMAIKQIVESSQTDLLDTLKAQGQSISKIEQSLQEGSFSEKTALEVFRENLSEIKDAYNRKNSGVSFRFGYSVGKDGKLHLTGKKIESEEEITKAADVHNTSITGANASILQSFTADALLRLGADAPIQSITRNTPWILDFVNVTSSSMAQTTAIWIDEEPIQGAFALCAEGAVKPLVMYKHNAKSATREKVAGYLKFTDEFYNDLPKLYNKIINCAKIDVRNKMNANVLTSLLAYTSTYSNAALVGQIDNADDYAAIAAAVGQLGNFYHTPNVLVVNNNRMIVAASNKGTDGQYIDPTPLMNEINAGGIKIVRSPDVAFDEFIIGDGGAYNVDLLGDVIVRFGWENDDHRKNMFSVAVEQYYFAYGSQARKTGLVKGNFTTIKASIEKP
jgi:hypothetical protein